MPQFAAKSEATISAPPSHVYSLLTSATTWPTWNRFVLNVKILADPANNTNPVNELPMRVGQRLKFSVHMRFLRKLHKIPFGSVEKITVVDVPQEASAPQNRTVRWPRI